MVNAEKVEKHERKKIKKRKYESSVAWWMRPGLADGRKELCPALLVNFWVTVDYLYQFLVLSFTFCKTGLVVLTLL